MTFISRAVRYIVRKRIKSLIIFAILTLISTLLLASQAVGFAAQKESEKVESQASSSFVLSNNPQFNPGTPRGAGTVNPKDVSKISKIQGISSYVVRQNVTADLVNAKAARIPGVQDYDERREKQFGNAVNLEGTNDSASLNAFVTKTINLVKGKHINSKDTHVSFIHEDLAKLNNLKVGDKLILKANPYDADNVRQSKVSVTTTIVGIFGGANNRSVATRAELTANTIYTDLKTTRELYKYETGKEIYQDATFFVKRNYDADQIIKEASSLNIDLQSYQLTRNDQFVSGLINAAKGVRSMMSVTSVIVILFAIIALGLVLLLWFNERRREMGVLTSIGVKKSSMILQYISEIFLVSIFSIMLGYCISLFVSPWMGSSALSSVNSSAARELSSMGQAGGNLESSMATRTLDKLVVNVDLNCLAYTTLIIVFVIVISVLISSLPMLKKTPRELLGMQK